MLAIEIEQRLLVLRQAEVVALLFQPLDLAPTRRTLAVDELRFRDKDLVDRAVPAFVLALVDVAVALHAAPDLLRCLVVPRLRGTNEVVVRDLQIATHL